MSVPQEPPLWAPLCYDDVATPLDRPDWWLAHQRFRALSSSTLVEGGLHWPVWRDRPRG